MMTQILKRAITIVSFVLIISMFFGMTTFAKAGPSVKVSAVDIDSYEELEGATLQVLDSEAEIVEEWSSTKDTHEVQDLYFNEEYTLRTTVAPDGYLFPTDSTFKISGDGIITYTGSMDADNNVLFVEFEMTNVCFLYENDVIGATISVNDEEGNCIDGWIAETSHSITGLRIDEEYQVIATIDSKDYELCTFSIDEYGVVTTTSSIDASGNIILSIEIPEDVDEYDLWVGEVRVTSANAENVLNDSGDATVIYDVDTNTLTLNNATILGTITEDYTDSYGIKYLGEDEFTIVANGKSSIIVTESPEDDLITGSGGIVIGGNVGDYDDFLEFGETDVNIIVNEDSTLLVVSGSTDKDAYETSAGIILWCDMGTLTISGAGDLIVACGNSNYVYGISSNGEVILDSTGSVNIFASDNVLNSYGIQASSITINDGVNRILGGEADNNSYAISTEGGTYYDADFGDIIINSGDITLVSSEVPTLDGSDYYNQSHSMAVFCEGDFKINGGSMEAFSESSSGDVVKVFNKAPVLADGIIAGASKNFEGENAELYNSSNNDTYKYFKVPFEVEPDSIGFADIAERVFPEVNDSPLYLSGFAAFFGVDYSHISSIVSNGNELLELKNEVVVGEVLESNVDVLIEGTLRRGDLSSADIITSKDGNVVTFRGEVLSGDYDLSSSTDFDNYINVLVTGDVDSSSNQVAFKTAKKNGKGIKLEDLRVSSRIVIDDDLKIVYVANIDGVGAKDYIDEEGYVTTYVEPSGDLIFEVEDGGEFTADDEGAAEFWLYYATGVAGGPELVKVDKNEKELYYKVYDLEDKLLFTLFNSGEKWYTEFGEDVSSEDNIIYEITDEERINIKEFAKYKTAQLIFVEKEVTSLTIDEINVNLKIPEAGTAIELVENDYGHVVPNAFGEIELQGEQNCMLWTTDEFEGAIWYVDDNREEYFSGEMVEGETYYAAIWFWYEEGYHFSEDVNVIVNSGELLCSSKNIYGDGSLCAIVPVTIPAKDVETYLMNIYTSGDGKVGCALSGDELDGYHDNIIENFIPSGTTYTLYSQPGNGCSFVKWTKNGEDYSEGATITVTITEDVEYVAVFAMDNVESNYYTVTFELNGGTFKDDVDNPIEVEEGLSVTKPSDPTKTGFTFDGWYLDSDFKTKYDFNEGILEDKTIYAKWKVKSVTGGGGGSSSSSYKITTNTDSKNVEILPKNPSVKKNGSQEFTFNVKEGYEITDVLVDGKSVGAVNKYTIEKVTSKHTIEVKTAKKASLSDVDNWAKEEMTQASEKGLIPETFTNMDATKAISRADFCAVAVKLYEKLTGKNSDSATSNPFTDTNDDYVLKAYYLGITKGISNTEFGNGTITREQMATMVARTLEKAGIDTNIDLTIVQKFEDDSLMHDWGRPSVYYMANKEIIKGVGDNKFNPLGNAKVEEALAISLRCLNIII